MTTCGDCYKRNPESGYCPVRWYEVDFDKDACSCFQPKPKDMNTNQHNPTTMKEEHTRTTKVCKVCGRELPIEQFSKNRNGLLSTCKDCMKAKQKAGAKLAKTAKPEAPKEEPAHEPEPKKVAAVPDYEKKYKDAIGWMKKLYPLFDNATREDADHFFPELAELCPDVIPTKLMPNSGGISYPSVLYAVESWEDETVRFFLKDVVRILRDRGCEVECSIVHRETL